MKTAYKARYCDVVEPYRTMKRERVAYLLKAARSRGDYIRREWCYDNCYAYSIGELSIVPDNDPARALAASFAFSISLARHTLSEGHRRAAQSKLCITWNEATCPSTLRTDDEHEVCRRAARLCERLLRKHSLTDYREHESGFRYV